MELGSIVSDKSAKMATCGVGKNLLISGKSNCKNADFFKEVPKINTSSLYGKALNPESPYYTGDEKVTKHATLVQKPIKRVETIEQYRERRKMELGVEDHQKPVKKNSTKKRKKRR